MVIGGPATTVAMSQIDHVRSNGRRPIDSDHGLPRCEAAAASRKVGFPSFTFIAPNPKAHTDPVICVVTFSGIQ